MGNQKSRVPPPPVQQQPTMTLAKQMDILEKRRAQKEALVRTCAEDAKRRIALQDSRGALQQLKAKRRHEEELTKIYIMMDKLAELEHTTESAKITAGVLRATEAATTSIQSIGLDVDKADAILDASREAIDGVNDVSAVFGRMEVDPDIERELAEMTSTVQIPTLPVLPTHVPTRTLTSEEEIAQLEKQALPA